MAFEGGAATRRQGAGMHVVRRSSAAPMRLVLPPLPLIAQSRREGGRAASVALVVLPGSVVYVAIAARVSAHTMPQSVQYLPLSDARQWGACQVNSVSCWQEKQVGRYSPCCQKSLDVLQRPQKLPIDARCGEGRSQTLCLVEVHAVEVD